MGDVRRPTSDDWHPTRADGTVRVSVLHLEEGLHRVCVWGEDDFGMELDTDEATARRLFGALAAADPVSIDMLEGLGLRRA